MLELPESIFIQNTDDISRQDYLDNERMLHLVEGYTIIELQDNQDFKYQTLININHSQFWDGLNALIHLIPEPLVFSFGKYDQELKTLEKEFSRENLVSKLSKLANKISSNIEIEMSFQSISELSLVQLYVSDCKTFELYHSNKELIDKCMSDLGLTIIKDLATVEEFPRTILGKPEDSALLLDKLDSI